MRNLLLILVASCGIDSVPTAECPFWEPRVLDVTPTQQCWVDYSDAWTLVDADVYEVREGQALVGPVKLRRNYDSTELTPMVLAVDTDGQCIVLDCAEPARH